MNEIARAHLARNISGSAWYYEFDMYIDTPHNIWFQLYSLYRVRNLPEIGKAKSEFRIDR